MAGTSGQSGGKRVSFLMPYIDFCFMLIIVFVGMLSIAYFEPLGLTNIQSVKADDVNLREGKEKVMPEGVQDPNMGVGEKTSDTETVTPLKASDKSGYSEAQVADRKELEKLKKELEEKQKELERLKALEKELRAKEKELARLKELEEKLAKLEIELNRLHELEAKTETGPATIDIPGKGNHVYLDLRKSDADKQKQ